MTIPEQAVQAMPERIFLGCADTDNEHQVWTDEGEGGTEYVRADLAVPHLAAVRVKDEGKLLMEVTQAIFPEGWTLSNRNAVADGIRIVLSALEPSAGRAAVLEEAARVAEQFRNNDWIAHDMRTGVFPKQSEPGVAIAAAIRALHPVADKPSDDGAQGEACASLHHIHGVSLEVATALVEMFGGEETDMTVEFIVNGHSGTGFYCWCTEYPEDGSSYLGPASEHSYLSALPTPPSSEVA